MISYIFEILFNPYSIPKKSLSISYPKHLTHYNAAPIIFLSNEKIYVHHLDYVYASLVEDSAKFVYRKIL